MQEEKYYRGIGGGQKERRKERKRTEEERHRLVMQGMLCQGKETGNKRIEEDK